MRRFRPVVALLACLVAPAKAQEMPAASSAEEILALAKATYRGESCWWERVAEDIDQFETWELTFRYEHETDDGPDRTVRLYQMPCHYGAYNFASIWFIETEYEGLGPLHFAEPELDIDYGDQGSETVVDVRVIGFATTSSLVNAYFDEKTRTINSFSKWRGVGDASSGGTWIFREGRFVLTNYEVDATYNAEIDPVNVYRATPR